MVFTINWILYAKIKSDDNKVNIAVLMIFYKILYSSEGNIFKIKGNPYKYIVIDAKKKN